VSECPFCKRIAAGEYDTKCQGIVSFEPLNPVTPGHLLVVPMQHVTDAAEAPWTTGQTFFEAARLARASGQSFNLITSAGRLATQTVPHLHVHLIPRREGDGLALPWTGQAKTKEPTS
jgi:histidine triad (HIT) family protein